MTEAVADEPPPGLRRKTYLHIILPLFLTSIIAYLDRVNLSYAALTMNQDLSFSPQVFGLGAGVFFAGYVLFEIPGALIAERYSPKWWLARIMMSWGLVSGLLAFVTQPWEFYVLRFLLGAAEASLYPVLYASCIPRWFSSAERPKAIALLLTSLQISSIVGAPLAGWLVGLEFLGLKGWQTLFILEALPAIGFAFVLLRWLADSPREARWLSEEEKCFLEERFNREVEAKNSIRSYTLWEAFKDREVIKLCVAYFLWITGFWGFGYWMPTVLKAASGWSNLAVGWMIVVPMCLSLAFMLWIGDHSSKTGEKRWHGAIGMFLGALGLGCGTMTDQPLPAFLFMCLAAIGVYAPFGVMVVLSNHLSIRIGSGRSYWINQLLRKRRRVRRTLPHRLSQREDGNLHRRLALLGVLSRLRGRIDAHLQATIGHQPNPSRVKAEAIHGFFSNFFQFSWNTTLGSNKGSLLKM